MPKYGAIERRTSSQQVASRIRRMIFTGELAPGDRIPQDQVASEMGVSRIPVREAMIALDREGWVTIEPHRGAFVLGLDPDYVRDHYELLGRVYGLAASRATERGTDDEVAALRRAAAALADAGDDSDFARRNAEYLALLLEIAASPRISSVLRVMTGIVPGDFFAEVPGARATQVKGVRAITRAVRAHDEDRAADQAMAMLHRHGEAVVKLLAARELAPASPRS